MKIAHNPTTGEYLGLQDGQWKPLKIAQNEAGDRLYLGESGWEPLPAAKPRQTAAQPQEQLPARPQEPALQGKPAPQPSQPSGDSGLQLENPVEGEDYDAPTEGEKSFIQRGADAISSVIPTEAARQFGVGTRSVIQGLGSIADLARLPMNYVNGLLGGDPEYFKPQGKVIADALNLPEAKEGTEKLIQSGVEMGAAAVPWIMTGQWASGAANPVMQGVGKVMAMAPGEQVAGSALAGLASEKVRQDGGGTGSQIAAGIAAGLSPAATLTAARIAGRTGGTAARAADLFTEAGRDRAAGRTIARAAGGNPDDVVNAAKNAKEIVPGSAPTLGQLHPGENLATLEKGLQSSGQGQALQERYMAQAAARNTAADDAISAANARLAAEREAAAKNLPAGIDADAAGPAIRSVYDRNYAAARAATRKAYDDIDPLATARFDLEPIYEANARLIGTSRYAEVPAAVSSMQAKIAQDIGNGTPATYADLQAMRTTLTDMAESAARSGDAGTARIAQGMKKNLDDYLGNATVNGFTPEQAQRFEAARAARIQQGQDFETGVNQQMGRRGNTLTGEAVSDTAVAGRYFSKGNAGSENMRAFKRMAKGDKKADAAIKEYARGLLHSAAMGRDGMLSSAGIAKFRKDYAAALKEMPDLEKEVSQLEKFVRRQEQQLGGLKAAARQTGDEWGLRRGVDLQGNAGMRFGPQGTGTFTQPELDALAAVQADAARARRAEQVARVNGSPTAQLLATQDLARRFWGDTGTGAASSWLGSLVGNMAQGAANKFLFSGTNDAVTQRLVSAMLDPAYAAYLVNIAGKEAAKHRESLLSMMARSAGGAANVAGRTAMKDREKK